MISAWRAGIVLLASTGWTVPAGAMPELVENPGLERLDASGSPLAWKLLVMGAPAQLSSDENEKHGGARAGRLDAPEITRAYLHSGPIPVAAGEKLRIGAWVKARDVPAGQGTVILIAEFGRGEPRSREVAKIATADPRLAEWQHIQGTITIPAGVTTLRLRMGLSYSKGTLWWDEVSVEPLAPVAARADLPEARLYPAAPLPITVLNRAGLKGKFRLRVQVGDQTLERDLTLTGRPVRQDAMAAPRVGRGKCKLNLQLVRTGETGLLFASPDQEVLVPPPLTLMPLIPTHGVVEDGAQPLEGRIEMALDGSDRQGGLAVRLEDETGAARAKWERNLQDLPPSGLVDFQMQVPELPAGRYRVIAQVADGSGAALSAEQPWEIIPRRQARVTLNAAGFPEREGKAIFPLGMFNNTARIAESAAAGFNVVHAYNAARVHPGRRPDDQRLKNVLDQAAAAGMHFLLLVPMEYAFSGEWDAFRRRIRMFRNHPALLAWDEEEGIARGDMNLQTLAKIRQILREEDPHHPFMVGDSHDVIARVADRSRFFPAEQMDLGMWWWYPFPLNAGPADALQGEEASAGMLLQAPEFLVRRTTQKPLWVGIQSYKKPGRTARYPTPAEYRAQAYLAIIDGAKGLMWYGGSVTGGLFLAPAEGHWDDLKNLAGELHDLESVLVNSDSQPVRVEPAAAPVSAALKATAAAPVSAALKEAPARRILIAVNRSNQSQDVTLSLREHRPAEVIGENRTVEAKGGQIKDRFEPYATHVYSWR